MTKMEREREIHRTIPNMERQTYMHGAISKATLGSQLLHSGIQELAQ